MQDNIFSSDDLHLLNQLPEVLEAKTRLNDHDTVSFRVSHPAISQRLKDLNLPAPSEIPMRWIKGDTEEHVDQGGVFEKTSLVYLNGSGDFIIGAETFSIQENRAFTFDEGTKHRTENASSRLILGPMDEFGHEVGVYGTTGYKPYGGSLSLAGIGRPGDFLNWFSTTNPVLALSYSSYLETYALNGAFVQNFHMVQFQQLDGALNSFRLGLASATPSFASSSDWNSFLRNTTFMLQNINERMNLINEGLQVIFGNADAFSNTTQSAEYLSETQWQQGESWDYLPGSLLDSTSDFAAATYGEDANEVPHPLYGGGPPILLP